MENSENRVSVLVIGAGIAGIESSLLLANSGAKVYLVEKASYFGGNIIKWEEVFPNMECATCMIAPKQQELLQNENIELLTLSEVNAVDGSVGDFTVKVKRKARYVTLDNCIGCNECFGPCPVEVDNEFEEGLSKRKAIYIPCAGALPNAPVIDTDNCLRFKGEDCQLCQAACAFEAIDYTQKDEELELKVGAIVVATGFKTFDLTQSPQYGYKKLDNVYSIVEVERLCASNGPTEGKIVLQSGEAPKSAAIIHCVGREEKGYCSSVCCMASIKQAHFLKNKIPGIKITQLYSDLCVPGRVYQRFYEEVKQSGVGFIRGTVNEVTQQGMGVAIKYKTENGEESTLNVDILILAPAIEPAVDSPKLAEILSIPQDEHGFFSEKEPDLDSVDTAREGVFIAGCAQSPKDVPDTVAEAEATVGRILSLSGQGS
jgi:heterodisulfide reductase subunit A